MASSVSLSVKQQGQLCIRWLKKILRFVQLWPPFCIVIKLCVTDNGITVFTSVWRKGHGSGCTALSGMHRYLYRVYCLTLPTSLCSAVQHSAAQHSAAQRSTAQHSAEPSVSTLDRTATTDMVKSPLTEPRRSLESRLICLNAIQWEDQRSFSTGLNSLRSSRQWAIMIDMTPGGKVVDFWWSYPLLLRGDYSLQYPSVKGYPRAGSLLPRAGITPCLEEESIRGKYFSRGDNDWLYTKCKSRQFKTTH